MDKKANEGPLKGEEPDIPAGTADKAVTGKKNAAKDTDTEPDEFLGPEADTDQPVDRQILNDAVLQGEKPFGDEEGDETDEKEEAPKKMDAGKL